VFDICVYINIYYILTIFYMIELLNNILMHLQILCTKLLSLSEKLLLLFTGKVRKSAVLFTFFLSKFLLLIHFI